MQHNHALIIGGSIAGLLAARALSEKFQRVTIIERDRLPLGAEFRPGVPQGRHLHALLAEGERIMEAFFPGLGADLEQAGASRMTWGLETATLTPGGWVKRFDLGIVTHVVTRNHLEWTLREHLSRRATIEFIEEVEVETLNAVNGRVTGVTLRDRRDQSIRSLEADLIVDASGRKSKAPEWLVALGYDAPEETMVNSHVGYATRWYEAKGSYDWKTLIINPRPDENLLRGGGILVVEGSRWIVTLVGTNKDYPPTDEEGFLAFARSLKSPMLYDLIREATPISPIYGFRYEGSRRRHFERLNRRPEGFVVVGDATCSFNPVYGQGMTVAALEAQALAQQMSAHRAGEAFAAGAQKAVFAATERAWLMATGEDLRYPGTEGKRPNPIERLIQRYTARLLYVLPHDERVALAFMQAMNLTRAPSALLTPSIVLRVLRHALSRTHTPIEHQPLGATR